MVLNCDVSPSQTAILQFKILTVDCQDQFWIWEFLKRGTRLVVVATPSKNLCFINVYQSTNQNLFKG